ncbi:hypothetical protein OIDMADRAFT_60203 [Oidiodendron maius Zn]|uniref:Uncharacterized protein n=1 Tax=Oidiodendron maius (strain Zn) TaxID=913774 RepID=A0A0C3GXR1_OIDMZ|nr:hypothetical protein OIDMADRAFT_60203 [Oidiodendron maius Zn]
MPSHSTPGIIPVPDDPRTESEPAACSIVTIRDPRGELNTGYGSGAVQGGTIVGTVAEGERRPQCEWLRARATASTHRPDETVTSTGSRCGRGIGDLGWGAGLGRKCRLAPFGSVGEGAM